MKNYTIMLKPASSLCNLRCCYCFYADVSQAREIPSYGIMDTGTVEGLMIQTFLSVAEGDCVHFVFQGGEPTLVGLAFFRYFVRRAEDCRGKTAVSYALQTNGILLDEEWCRFLKEWDFLVGVSLDISRTFHNKVRLDGSGKGTFGQAHRSWLLLERVGVDCNMLAVLTGEMARHPQQVWRSLVNEKVRYVQFIPCIEELNPSQVNPHALTPKRFAQFYNGLFPQWLDAFLQGQYISIKFFDDLLNLLAHGQVTACGLTGQCRAQLVVESDGSVYPCDFYVLDEYRMGNLSQQTISEVLAAPAVQTFCQREAVLPTLCQDCAFLSICHGGCKRMRRSMYIQDDFCGYRDFLQQNAAALQQLAER